jgi:hypothetical protein
MVRDVSEDDQRGLPQRKGGGSWGHMRTSSVRDDVYASVWKYRRIKSGSWRSRTSPKIVREQKVGHTGSRSVATGFEYDDFFGSPPAFARLNRPLGWSDLNGFSF